MQTGEALLQCCSQSRIHGSGARAAKLAEQRGGLVGQGIEQEAFGPAAGKDAIRLPD